MKKVDVLRDYIMGSAQEFFTKVLFAGPNKAVAIIEQGKFRIYNTNTWVLMGTLNNYVWSFPEVAFGHEDVLSHAESFIAEAKYINRRLYILSSGGVIRIYNVDKYRLVAVIELPIEYNNKKRIGCLDKYYLSDDASLISYSFEDQPYFYKCYLPQISE